MKSCKTWARHLLTYGATLQAALLLAGCATGFHRDWKQATDRATPTDDITGRWQGTWQSEVTGHHGALRCVAAKDALDKYRFHYYATYRKILHGAYSITQDVQRVDHTFKMHGGADLPKMFGGHFEYEGEATPTNFFSTYRSKDDRGTFQMARPKE